MKILTVILVLSAIVLIFLWIKNKDNRNNLSVWLDNPEKLLDGIPDTTVEYARCFVACVLQSLQGNPEAEKIAVYFPKAMVEMVAAVAGEKMHLTRLDGAEHSSGVWISEPNSRMSDVVFIINTIPASLEEAASWYEQNYGGYLANMLLAQKHWKEISSGRVIRYVFITFGMLQSGKSSVWCSMSIPPSSAGPPIILAGQLLTKSEMDMIQKVGLV